MADYTTIEAQVEYGLSGIATDRKVEVSLRDLLYIHQTLGELIRFFHQRNHYPDVEEVNKFLSESEASAYHLMSQCYHDKLRDIWPQDVVDKFDAGDFDHPNPPYYYQSSSED